MIFLNPAVLFGLIAASIPVLIHLLNLKKLKKIEFSTLSFLKELQKNKIRKLKLKQWLLLALRVLIILFVVMAFARPALKGFAIGGTTSAAKTTAIFILDDTFSMSAVDANGSYFNQAKQTIINLLKNLQEGDEAALIPVSYKGNEEIKPTLNLDEFSKQVRNADISYSSGTLNQALIKAGEILNKSKNFNREIYLLSDFQKGRISDEKSPPDLSKILNDKIKLYSFNLSGKEIFNLGIDDLIVNTQIFEKDKPVNFSVAVTNYSNQPVDNTVLSLFINGERSAQQSISLNEGESKVITMEAIAKSTGYLDVSAELEDDDILQDNKRYANFYIPDKIPVAIFYNNESDINFVETALSLTGESGAIKITPKNLNQFSSYDLSQFNVIIVDGSINISSEDRLKSFVENGGGLFLMPEEENDMQSFSNMTSKLGLPSSEGAVGKLNAINNAVAFDKIEYDHPIFQNIFSQNEKKQLESPDIYFHYKISTRGKGVNIITLTDGTSFLGDYKIGKGKVLILNTSPVLSWSNLPLKNIFAPLILKSVFYLASRDKPGSDYFAGNPVTITLSGITLPQIKVERPDKTEELINLEKSGTLNFITYNKTTITGNYKFYSGQQIVDEVSVNTNPEESVTKYISETDFNNYLTEVHFKGNHIQIPKNENPSDIVLQSRFGSELWRLFLIAALITALVEMALARSTKKDLV
ncbi:MAG TPA: BatA and WFA domain-containing protein [Ignavibacteriaceae bacterium]|nr:BatA and WFA domain-containing protein [Ignavibacteriaceae bacterium]